MKIMILKGLPASGKSTWAKEFIRTNQGWKRINKDDLRSMLDDGQWSRKNEEVINTVKEGLMLSMLQAGYNVIIDDTNFAPKHEQRIRTIAGTMKAAVEVKEFNTDVEECIARDLKRCNSVGEKVIRDMYNKYLKPRTPERKYNGEPNAIICDIDGTLALMDGRGPFDWDKVDTDIPNIPIVKLVRSLDTVPLLLFSGRDSVCREKTEKWLKEFDIDYDELYMRAEGDTRKDSIIKKELFNQYVDGKWNILYVLDDRDQVVDMWRNELGLTCLQVAEGNF